MSNPYDVVVFVLAAGETREIPIPIAFITMVNATNRDAVAISFDGSTFPQLIPGLGPAEFPRQRVWVRNTDTVENTITLVTGEFRVYDTRLIFDGNNPATVAVSGNVATTVANGANVAQGSTTDAVATGDTATSTVVALLKRLNSKLQGAGRAARAVGQSGAMTGTGDTAVIAAPAAGFHLVLSSLTIVCKHATVGTEVVIKNGASELFRVYVDSLAGDNVSAISVPLPDGVQLATATALNAANITTGSDVNVVAAGFVEAD